MTSGEPWDRYRIAAEVKRRGSTLGAISINAGLAEPACRNALVLKSQSAERAIAAFLGVPLHELWPDRWLPDGTRIDRRRKDHSTGERTRRAVKNERAA